MIFSTLRRCVVCSIQHMTWHLRKTQPQLLFIKPYRNRDSYPSCALILSPSALTSFMKNKSPSRVGVLFCLITDNINRIRSHGGDSHKTASNLYMWRRWSNALLLVTVWQVLGRTPEEITGWGNRRQAFKVSAIHASKDKCIHRFYTQRTRLSHRLCCFARSVHLKNDWAALSKKLHVTKFEIHSLWSRFVSYWVWG